MKKNNIILASSSPRRKELLEKEGIDFRVDASSIEEIMDESLPLDKRLIKLACDKAKPIHNKYPSDVVIGADTVVSIDDKVIGKAQSKQEAKDILLSLSRRKQTVYSAVALYIGDELVTFCEHTDVYFKDIDHLIDDYLENDEWVGKAGAYAIQSMGSMFVEKISGEKDTVIGLPVKKIKKVLQEYGVI